MCNYKLCFYSCALLCSLLFDVVMKPNERRAELVRRGVKVASIARELGITGPSVSQVINERRSTPRIKEAIAKAIGKPVDEVFPDPTKEAA